MALTQSTFFIFCPFLIHFFTLKESGIEKKLSIIMDKIQPWGYPNISKSRPYLVSIFQEKYDCFCPILTVFILKKDRSQSLNDWNQKLTEPILEPRILGLRVWSHSFPVLNILIIKVIFLIFKALFKVWLFFCVPRPINWYK